MLTAKEPNSTPQTTPTATYRPPGCWPSRRPAPGSAPCWGWRTCRVPSPSPSPSPLEIAGDAAGVTLLARCREGSFVKQQLGVHYPQARVSDVSSEDDQLRLADGEQSWAMNLRLQGPEYLPLRTFRDDDLPDQGSDP